MEGVICRFGHRVGLQYHLSSTNRCTDREDQQDIRGHVEDVCDASTTKVGGVSPLVEFAYNNGYQESLRMSPFRALCGWSCSTPISWSDLVSRVLIGPYMLADIEQEMQVIKKNLNTTPDR